MSKKQNSEVVQLFSTNGSKTLSKLIITPVDGKGRFGNTYRHHFVSVLHEVMAHSTLLPRCPHDKDKLVSMSWDNACCVFAFVMKDGNEVRYKSSDGKENH